MKEQIMLFLKKLFYFLWNYLKENSLVKVIIIIIDIIIMIYQVIINVNNIPSSKVESIILDLKLL